MTSSRKKGVEKNSCLKRNIHFFVDVPLVAGICNRVSSPAFSGLPWPKRPLGSEDKIEQLNNLPVWQKIAEGDIHLVTMKDCLSCWKLLILFQNIWVTNSRIVRMFEQCWNLMLGISSTSYNVVSNRSFVAFRFPINLAMPPTDIHLCSLIRLGFVSFCLANGAKDSLRGCCLRLFALHVSKSSVYERSDVMYHLTRDK